MTAAMKVNSEVFEVCIRGMDDLNKYFFQTAQAIISTVLCMNELVKHRKKQHIL